MTKKDTKTPKSSKYIGVTLQRTTGKWTAQHRLQGAMVYLGAFSTQLEAAYAYDDARREALSKGYIPSHNSCLNFPQRLSENAHDPDLRHFRNTYRKSNTEFVGDPFRCKGITLYAERNVWKTSYSYKRMKLYVGAYSSQENAIRAGLDFLITNSERLKSDWLDRTIKAHHKVLGMFDMINETNQFDLPPLLFSASRSATPLPKNIIDDADEVNFEELLRWESPSLDL